jgi:hypothetical protein
LEITKLEIVVGKERATKCKTKLEKISSKEKDITFLKIDNQKANLESHSVEEKIILALMILNYSISTCYFSQLENI